MFTQLFTILGARERARTRGGGEDETVALPFVFALLSSKKQEEYASVLKAVKSAVETNRIGVCEPEKIMSDFELSIINACTEEFPNASVTCCFFHMGQSLYRKTQEVGLQAQYNDPDDRSIKENAHMLLALAYVPEEDVKAAFNIVKAQAPAALVEVLTYFSENYVHGRPARGRRAAVRPRYPPQLWNQHEAARLGEHKTNNVSEGWHNRFRLVVGKHHPDLYSALHELQKEEADTEVSIRELALGKKIKAAPKKKWIMLQDRIKAITLKYDEYKNGDRELEFLRALGHNITL